MNWLDVVLLLLIAGSIITSFRKGFSRELIGLISVVVGLFCGLWFYGSAGALLRPYLSSDGIANFCGFLLVFFGVLILGAVLGYLFGRLVKAAGLTTFDRILGAGFGAVRGLLLAVALIVAIVAFAPGPSVDAPPRAVVHSRFAPYVIDTAHLFASLAPRELKDGFRKHYGQVKSIWDDALKKGVHRLPDSEV
ncbi:MAG TPA: CvpA family protein [Bryobacteraceae bacterium]|nr:CvpA family protein [Bryobacteraceae bacterium]